MIVISTSFVGVGREKSWYVALAVNDNSPGRKNNAASPTSSFIKAETESAIVSSSGPSEPNVVAFTLPKSPIASVE